MSDTGTGNGEEPVTPTPTPPLIGTDEANSAPGVEQPQFAEGDADTPATPQNITGSPIIPTSTPPGGIGQIGDPVGVPTFPPEDDDTAPVPIPETLLVGPAIAPAPVPPSIAGVTQPQFAGGGSATIPASLFPDFTTDGPQQPIIVNSTQAVAADTPASPPGDPPTWIAPPPVIVTPGMEWPPTTGLPTTPGVAPIVMSEEWGQPPPPTPGPPPPVTPPDENGENGEEETEPVHETLAMRVGLVPKPKGKPRARKKR